MSRENARDKGMRYLVEHRLSVLHVGPESVEAECRGGGAVYQLEWRAGEWSCTCPARSTCSHLYALWAVTVRGAA